MKVLVVDGHPAVRPRLAALVAEIPGVDGVLQARGRVQATDVLVLCAPDLVILDLNAAADSDLGLVARLKQLRPKTVFVVLTTGPTERLCRACVARGADHVLDKSRDIGPLQAVIEHIARRIDFVASDKTTSGAETPHFREGSRRP